MKLSPLELDALVWQQIRLVRVEGQRVAEPDESALKERAEWYLERALHEVHAGESLPDAIRLIRQLWPES